MEAQFEARKQELLAECEIASQVFEQVIPRLERFMRPFVARLVRQEQIDHALTMVQGLLSRPGRKEHGVDRVSVWSGTYAVAVVCWCL